MANVATVSSSSDKQKRGKRPARRLFNVDEYYRMAEAGIFGPDERVELIDGIIIEMASMGSPHAGCVMALNQWFGPRIHDRALISVQLPVRLSDFSEPEPDIALVRMRSDIYRTGHPETADVLLLIEAADSSVSSDRRRKLPLYARESVPETWLVDLPHERVEIHRTPEHGRYQHVQTFGRGGSLSPLAFPDLRISVDEILG